LSLEDAVRVHHLIERREKALRLAETRRRLERDRGPMSLADKLALKYPKVSPP
jgi:hypothetical protein